MLFPETPRPERPRRAWFRKRPGAAAGSLLWSADTPGAMVHYPARRRAVFT